MIAAEPVAHDEASELARLTRHNLVSESFFSAFNGIYLGLAIFAAPVVAVTAVEVTPLELTVLVSAFPVGAFLGPLWAYLGRRWGMQTLVTQMAIWANIPLLLIFWIGKNEAALFTALITVSQLLNSAMRMGQSTLYRVMYAREMRGRVLGRLTFWSYVTLVPTILATGWLLEASREIYQVLYPLAGLCGLVGSWFYSTLQVPRSAEPVVGSLSFRAGVQGVERILAQDRMYFLFQVSFFLSGSAFFMSTHVVLLLTQRTRAFAFGPFELALWMTVVPQILLALSSPAWGRILDRLGIVYCRLLINVMMTVYLASYFFAIDYGVLPLIFLGSIFQGLANGGGQLTWALASSHFAPRAEDVPLYNEIHFVLNGIRGLVMPWVGSIMFVLSQGPLSVLAATLMSLASIPVIVQALRLERTAARDDVMPRAQGTTAKPE
ncbi:MAG: MFS transporter [Planctomycetes bacterium]|nr:MFS transporter [Planctomycetota bacterium]